MQGYDESTGQNPPPSSSGAVGQTDTPSSSAAVGRIRVKIEHVRAAKLCVNGARAWFARYDLDFRSFLRDGLPAETLRATGDPLAERAIAEAMKEGQSHG